MIVALLGTLAFASEPRGPAPHAPNAAPASHGAEAGGEHGGGHGHHYYTDDDDHDGVANWMDSTNGTAPNEDTYVLKSIGLHAINLLVLIGLGAYFVLRPMGDFFRDRALRVKNELTDTARRRDEAHQRHQELLARLARIEGEVQAMEQTAERESQREEEQLVERARREATRITEQAERNIRDEVARARNTLRAEAVELAVRLAETTLRTHASIDDQRALARAFLDSVNKGESRV